MELLPSCRPTRRSWLRAIQSVWIAARSPELWWAIRRNHTNGATQNGEDNRRIEQDIGP
jgi:hypothetical protein